MEGPVQLASQHHRTAPDAAFPEGDGVVDRQEGRIPGASVRWRPGVEVMWHGLQKLDVAIDMYLIYRPEERPALRREYPPWYLSPDQEAPDSG